MGRRLLVITPRPLTPTGCTISSLLPPSLLSRRARNRLNTSFHQQRKALHLVYVKFVEDYLDVVYPESEGGARLMAKDDEMIDWQVRAPLPA